MPFSYRRDAARLKADIVARVSAGEHLRSVCASPGLPAKTTVRRWAREDAPFGAALNTAHLQGSWRRMWTFDEAKAEAFLARARAGERIADLWREPGMPSRVVYQRWRTAQPPFAEAAFALRKRRDAFLRELAESRRRHFDQAVADRIVVQMNKGMTLEAVMAGDPATPDWRTLARWRREQPQFDLAIRMVSAAWRGKVRPVPAARVAAVVAHIVKGGSLFSFSRLRDAPSYGALRRWMRDPGFAAAVAQACEDREDWYRDQIEMVAERMPQASARDLNQAVAPLTRQLARLRHRPKPAVRTRRG